MTTRIVMIHPGPSCDCPCDLCRDDGADSTPWQHDCDGTCCHDDHDRQGRTPESVRGTEDNLWLLAKVAAVLAVVIALWAALNGGAS